MEKGHGESSSANAQASQVFLSVLKPSEKRILEDLDSPAKIQAFLDGVAYSPDPFYRCPLRVLRERIGHCFDGAVFAAFALSCIGYPPLILELLPNERDDDHLLALFKREGRWGAVAKSNFVGLRYREPIHRTLRELVLSYFEQYYNLAGEKTLRGYTVPLHLSVLGELPWPIEDGPLDVIAEGLDRIRRFSLLTPGMIADLAQVDERSLQAGLLGSIDSGLFRPD